MDLHYTKRIDIIININNETRAMLSSGCVCLCVCSYQIMQTTRYIKVRQLHIRTHNLMTRGEIEKERKERATNKQQQLLNNYNKHK